MRAPASHPDVGEIVPPPYSAIMGAIENHSETSVMSTIDANRVILTGENSVIRLNNDNSDAFTSNAAAV